MISRRQAAKRYLRWDRYVARLMALGLSEQTAAGSPGFLRADDRLIDAEMGVTSRKGYVDKCTRGVCGHDPCGRRERQKRVWEALASHSQAWDSKWLDTAS